mmetsp:Transcript_48397/g.140203  ORF Transcript_48397/g.140203 Transcript_48397/m.140203 type:complete len:593 (-) Transcript_48397:93-1871(-)
MAPSALWSRPDLEGVLCLPLQDKVQCLLRGSPRDEDVGDPCGQAFGRADDAVAGLGERPGPDDAGLAAKCLEVRQGLERARALGGDEVVGHRLEGRLRHRRPRGDAQRQEERLLHEVHAPGPEIVLVHRAATHTCIHLNQLRPRGGVLALCVEDTRVEAERGDAADREVLQLALLLQRQQRGADAPRLVEVGLDGGPVVRDGRVAPLALRDHDVDVHLLPVEVLLQEHGQVHHRRRRDALAGSITLCQGPAHDDHGAEVGDDLPVAAGKLVDRRHLLHAQGGGPGDRLQHGREADVLRRPLQVPLRPDQAVPGRGQPGCPQRRPRRVLVPRGVHGGGRGPRQAEALGEPRDQGHGELHEGADGVGRAHGGVALQGADARHGVLEDLAGRPAHVQRNELGSDALVHEAARPRVGMVDDDGLDAQVGGPLEDEPLPRVAGCEEDDGQAMHQPPAQGLTIRTLRLKQLRRQVGEHLARGVVGLLALERLQGWQGLRKAAWRSDQLLDLELRPHLGPQLREHVRPAQLAVHVQGHVLVLQSGSAGAGGTTPARPLRVRHRRRPGLHRQRARRRAIPLPPTAGAVAQTRKAAAVVQP